MSATSGSDRTGTRARYACTAIRLARYGRVGSRNRARSTLSSMFMNDPRLLRRIAALSRPNSAPTVRYSNDHGAFGGGGGGGTFKSCRACLKVECERSK